MTAPTATRPRRLAGVALVSDTVSLNRRLYRRSVVEAACELAQERIRGGRMLMCSSHAAADADDALAVIGRVVEMTCDQAGVLRYTAEESATRAGHEVFNLCSGPQSHLGVSIRGRWLGPLVKEDGPDGLGPVEHSPDGLELLGLDTTLNPGVAAATAQVIESRRDPLAIRETATAVRDGPVAYASAAEHLASWFDGQLAEQRAVSAARHAAAVEHLATGGPPTTEDERRRALAAWVMGR